METRQIIPVSKEVLASVIQFSKEIIGEDEDTQDENSIPASGDLKQVEQHSLTNGDAVFNTIPLADPISNANLSPDQLNLEKLLGEFKLSAVDSKVFADDRLSSTIHETVSVSKEKKPASMTNSLDSLDSLDSIVNEILDAKESSSMTEEVFDLGALLVDDDPEMVEESSVVEEHAVPAGGDVLAEDTEDGAWDISKDDGAPETNEDVDEDAGEVAHSEADSDSESTDAPLVEDTGSVSLRGAEHDDAIWKPDLPMDELQAGEDTDTDLEELGDTPTVEVDEDEDEDGDGMPLLEEDANWGHVHSEENHDEGGTDDVADVQDYSSVLLKEDRANVLHEDAEELTQASLVEEEALSPEILPVDVVKSSNAGLFAIAIVAAIAFSVFARIFRGRILVWLRQKSRLHSQ